MNEKRKEGRKAGGILLQLVLLALVPLLIAIFTVAFIAIVSMVNGMQSESLDALADLGGSVKAAYEMVDGEYHVEGDALYKGDMNLTEAEDLIDSFVEGSESDVTLFYGDTRYATSLTDHKTGERIIGTKASDEVVDIVLNKGEDYSSADITINDEGYYAYYMPIKDSEGKVVGIVFTGKPKTDIDAFIQSRITTIVFATVLMVIIAGVIATICGRKIVSSIKEAERIVSTIAEGDLTTSPSESLMKKKDEVGTMARAIENLRSTLYDMVSDVMSSAEQLSETGKNLDSMASQTDGTASEISSAVEGISQGAVSQAEEIDTASQRVTDIGNEIGEIAEKAKTLDDASFEVQKAGNESGKIVNELLESNTHTVDAIASIEQQVRATNESVGRIKDAVSVISDIAAQTNLLSLNASIEAARAGDMGKGFAVVATEISNLAAQSGSSSSEIEDIVNRLYAESEKSMEAMEAVKKNIEIQEKKLHDTIEQFAKVEDGIAVSKNETVGISKKSEQCNMSRQVIMDVMTNLSAISEQNAASTEETMASMEELNATISLLAQEANRVSDMSEMLEEKIKVFKL